MTTNTDALDRIIAAHAEQARKLERADRTIRRLRKQLAAATERAEKAEKLVECAHDILGMERAKHAKALRELRTMAGCAVEPEPRPEPTPVANVDPPDAPR